MKQNTKRIFAPSVLGLFVFVFSMQFVAANPIGDFFIGFASDWNSGDVSPDIAKYLLAALITILIFSVSKSLPGLKSSNESVRWAFSIIVAFLSMAYITPDEVYSLMISYNALGFTLGIFIPFVILLYFTFDLASTRGNAVKQVSSQIIAILLWVSFTVFAFARAFSSEEGVAILSWFIAFAALIMTISIKTLMVYVAKQIHGEKRKKAVTQIGDAATVEKARAQSVDSQ